MSEQAEIHPASETPSKSGWYECWAIDDRWSGQMQYRAFGNGLWWTPLKDGWVSGRHGVYRWRGPVADANGPAPDGTNPEDSAVLPASEGVEKNRGE